MLLIPPLRDQLLVFNPTAHYLWHVLKRVGRAHLVRALSRRYRLPTETAKRDANAILVEWDRLGLLDPVPPGVPICDAAQRPRVFEATPDRLHLHFGDLQAVVQASRRYSELLEPLFGAAAGGAIGTGATECVLQSYSRGSGRLVVDGCTVLDHAEPTELIGTLCVVLLEKRSPDTPLCAVMHAAAVARGGRAVLLAGPSGSGKTTLTAYLAAHNYLGLCDDIVALRHSDFATVTLPIPMSIKPGALDILRPLYPSLRSHRGTPQPLPLGPAALAASVPVRALVFPTYKAGAAVSFEPVSLEDALDRLLRDRLFFGLPPDTAKVKRFVSLLGQVERRSLIYGDVRDAERCIATLLPA